MDNLDTAISERFALFQKVRTDRSYDKSFVIDYLSSAFSENSNVYEFHIPSNSSNYIDLFNSTIQFKFTIVNEDGSPIDWTVEPIPSISYCNNIGHTMFRTGELTLNNMSLASDHMSYRCMFKALTEKSPTLLESEGTNAAFYLDNGSFKLAGPVAVASNAGAFYRTNLLSESNDGVEVLGHIKDMFDLAEQKKLIPSGVNLILRLYPHGEQFVLLNGEATRKFKFKMLNIKFFVTYVNPAPGLAVALEDQFLHSNALLPYIKHDFRVYSISAGSTSLELNNMFAGKIPSKLTLAFVEQDNYTGTEKKNPFYFEHLDISNISLCLNGSTLCPQYVCNFEDANYTQAMLASMESAGADGTVINRSLYKEGHTVFKYLIDASVNIPDLLPRYVNGDTRLSVTFSKPTPTEMSLILMCERPAILKVTKSRLVTLEE